MGWGRREWGAEGGCYPIAERPGAALAREARAGQNQPMPRPARQTPRHQTRPHARPPLRVRLAVLAALLFVAFPATVVLYHQNTPAARLLRHANALVAGVESGRITHADELRQAMPTPPDFDGITDDGTLELSWFLGPDGWFGGRWLIVHADPQTERIERAYVHCD